jgi:hypothetical protein
MSFWESDVVVYTVQRKPTLLQRRLTRRPTKHIQHSLITAANPGEIHGQIPSTSVQDRPELGPQLLGSLLINSTSQDHADIVDATTRDGVVRSVEPSTGYLRPHTSHVLPGSGAARHHHQPSTDTPSDEG